MVFGNHGIWGWKNYGSGGSMATTASGGCKYYSNEGSMATTAMENQWQRGSFDNHSFWGWKNYGNVVNSK
jgi:hypothetical protein